MTPKTITLHHSTWSVLLKKTLLLVFFPLLVLLNNCKKENENRTYTLTGRILNSCNNPAPIVGKEFVLQYAYNTGVSKGVEEKGRITTDANGKFSITYTNIKHDDIALNLVEENTFGQSIILGNIPQNNDLSVGDIYLNAETLLFYKMKISGVSTSTSDTLYYHIGSREQKIAGPFHEMQVIDSLTVHPFQLYTSNSLDTKKVTISAISWRTDTKTYPIQQTISFSICDKTKDVMIDLSQVK